MAIIATFAVKLKFIRMISLKDFFSFKKNRFFWLNIAGLIIATIAVCWGTLTWLDNYTHHGESHIVPDVKDKTIAEARFALQQQMMEGVVIDSSYVKGAPAGIVLDQKPQGGARVKEGRTIYLTVTTTHVPLVSLPDLIDNSSLRQAEAKLKAMGFKLTEPEYVSGEQDWVYGIKYRGRSLSAGDKVPNEALLTLCIGNKNMQNMFSADSTLISPDTASDNNRDAEVDGSWF